METATARTTTSNSPEGAATPVTLWFRLGDKGFEFNHLEDGHTENDKPTPKVSSQTSAWARGVWVRERAWLDAGVPPKVLHVPENETARRVAISLAK